MVKFDLLYSVRFIREMLSGTWNENGSVFEFQLKTVIAGCYNRDFRLIRLQQCYCFRPPPFSGNAIFSAPFLSSYMSHLVWLILLQCVFLLCELYR